MYSNISAFAGWINSISTFTILICHHSWPLRAVGWFTPKHVLYYCECGSRTSRMQIDISPWNQCNMERAVEQYGFSVLVLAWPSIPAGNLWEGTNRGGRARQLLQLKWWFRIPLFIEIYNPLLLRCSSPTFLHAVHRTYSAWLPSSRRSRRKRTHADKNYRL